MTRRRGFECGGHRALGQHEAEKHSPRIDFTVEQGEGFVGVAGAEIANDEELDRIVGERRADEPALGRGPRTKRLSDDRTQCQ